MSLTIPQNLANTISSNCSSIQLNNLGLSATVNGLHSRHQVPKISLKFADPENRTMTMFSNQSLINMTHQFFSNHYFCGDGVEFNSTDESKRVVKIVSRDGENEYQNNTIYLKPNNCNPIVLLHEIIHSIINEVDDSYHIHNNTYLGLCGNLDVYTNGAPGFMLDIVNRLEMYYTSTELGLASHGTMYLPVISQADDLYPSLNVYCTQLEPFNVCSDDESESQMHKNVNPNLNRKSRISTEKFMRLKFHDEYNTLRAIKGFRMEMDLNTYIDRNYKEFISAKNVNKCNNK